jgi:hypothetical protein
MASISGTKENITLKDKLHNTLYTIHGSIHLFKVLSKHKKNTKKKSGEKSDTLKFPTQ